MTHYFDKLRARVNKWSVRYEGQPVRCHLHLIWWALYRSFCLPRFKKYKRNKKCLKVAFILNGGLGDVVINAAYIRDFSTLLKDTDTIDVYYTSKEILTGVFFNQKYVCKVYEKACFKKNDWYYDLVLDLVRMPVIHYMDERKIKSLNQSLMSVLESIKQFRRQNAKLFYEPSVFDTLSILSGTLTGHTRYDQAYVDPVLPLVRKGFFRMAVDPRSHDILKRTHLEKRAYITIQRGTGMTCSDQKAVTRLWPRDDYNHFIHLFKKVYPDILIVLLGLNTYEGDGIEADIDLRGKTTFEELKHVLKGSLFHLDAESGLVHLKHALGGKSIVLFGPTSVQFYGYPDNINLKGAGCAGWCEWIKNDWRTACLRGYELPPCMASIKPERVFEAAQRLGTISNKKKDCNDMNMVLNKKRRKRRKK